jgi:hypothetical protein
MIRMARRLEMGLLPAVAGFALGCADTGPPIADAAFRHEIGGARLPWTSEAFDDDPATFTFAVVSDLNGGERERVFEIAVAQLALLRPELILSVGDLIDGASEDVAALTTEWDAFDRRAGAASAPLFRVGGNHDLTGQVLRDVWSQRYGPRYYSFVYKDVLFLVLDTEDHTDVRMREIHEARSAAIDAAARGVEGVEDMEYYRMPERVTGNVGSEQAAYVLDVLARHPDVRWTMLFMHKPVWTDGADEEFVAIESALAARPYTVFNGHLHTMRHAMRNGRDYLTLGTTGGAQPADPMAFDHVTLVTVGEGDPSIVHLRLDGILDKAGRIPGGADGVCFQASACVEAEG